MSERSPEQISDQIRELLDSLYRVDSGRILATLIRLLGDFDLAEEAMHEAFAAALSLWPRSGVPGNPRPWLISTARFKAIDTLRRRARFDASQDELVRYLEAQWSSAERSNSNEEDSLEDDRLKDRRLDDDSLEDDRLRLIFTCCHPSLPPEARVALTLREVCGLTTEEIAKAFLTTPRTLAQRIVRAKAKIRETPIPYEVPTPQELPERLGAVLHVIYLVFNEGYSAAAGAEVTRAELTGEAIRLGRLLTELRPEPEGLSPENRARKACFRKSWVRKARGRKSSAGSDGAAFPDVAAGIPSRRENLSDRRADFAGESGPLALEPGADRGGSGIAGESPVRRPAASALTHCRLRLRPFMRRRNRSLRPTGGRLLRFTTNWYEFSLRRLYSSIVPWPLPCAMVQRPVWRISTRCWNMANWQIITWRIQPAQICTAGSAGPLRPGLLMRRRWR